MLDHPSSSSLDSYWVPNEVSLRTLLSAELEPIESRAKCVCFSVGRQNITVTAVGSPSMGCLGAMSSYRLHSVYMVAPQVSHVECFWQA